jgi:hypothetical protein
MLTPQQKAAEVLAQCPGVHAEIVGSWVWVSGDTKPFRATLKSLGLFFSGKKYKWYWHGSARRSRGHGWTYQQIVSRYGAQAVQRDTIPA